MGLLSAHWRVREKATLGTGSGGFLQMNTAAHCCPGCKSHGVHWSLVNACLWGKKRVVGEEKGTGMLPRGRGRVYSGSFILKVPKGRDLRGDPRGGAQ